jgi:hypothetical protein
MIPSISEISLAACQYTNYICKQAVKPEENKLPLKTPERLTSGAGINYQVLRYYLASGKWKEADKETTNIMMKLSQSETPNQLSLEELYQIPDADLITINYLWTKYSKGRFGFSKQGQIWQQLGGNNQEFLLQIYQSFLQRIGRTNNQVNYSIDAPEGHLPSAFMMFTNLSMRVEDDITSLSGTYLERGNIYCHHWNIVLQEKAIKRHPKFKEKGTTLANAMLCDNY